MRNRFAAYAVAAAVLLAVPLAYAAGLFPGFPVVGGAAYCNGTSTGATGTQVCTTTVPAGPTIVTGLERVPADTQIAGGGQPQTVSLTMASLNALPYTFTNVANGTSTNWAYFEIQQHDDCHHVAGSRPEREYVQPCDFGACWPGCGQRWLWSVSLSARCNPVDPHLTRITVRLTLSPHRDALALG